jgi:6,7-dimethyl-8-ribityllumazine synthase
MDVGIATGVPVGNGILTVDTPEQARRRADLAGDDKGGTAAAAALALVRLKRGGVTPAKPR